MAEKAREETLEASITKQAVQVDDAALNYGMGIADNLLAYFKRAATDSNVTTKVLALNVG